MYNPPMRRPRVRHHTSDAHLGQIRAEGAIRVPNESRPNTTCKSPMTTLSALQNRVQQPAAPSRTEFVETREDGNPSDLVLADMGPCEDVRDGRIPPRGLEPRSSG